MQAIGLWEEYLCVHSITADMTVTQSSLQGMLIELSATGGISCKDKEIMEHPLAEPMHSRPIKTNL